MWFTRERRMCALVLAVVGLCAGPTRGQDSKPAITLAAVPGRLVFPMEEGRNALLTAKVPVAGVRQVWLSPSSTFPGRVMLQRTGDRTFQINLAEDIVHRVLQADKRGRTFRVFAEGRKGTVYRSLAVAYKLASRRGSGKVVVRVWTEGKEPDSGDLYRRYETFRCGAKDVRSAPAWVSVGYTKRIGFYCDAAHRAYVRSGKQKWPMAPSGDDKAYFTLNAQAEQAIRQNRAVCVDYVLEDSGRKGTIDLKVPPARLNLPKGWAEVTLAEHRDSSVPGSEGYLRVRVGEIGSHRTLLSLSGRDGRPFIRQTSVRRNSKTVFVYEGRPYVLEVTRLHQSLFGADSIKLSIFPKPVTTRRKSAK